jgi:hypothetical protein
LGAGNDRLALSRSEATAGLTLDAGTGDDLVSIKRLNAGAALSVNLGLGNDRLLVSRSEANAAVDAVFNGGGGALDVLVRSRNNFATNTVLDFDRLG